MSVREPRWPALRGARGLRHQRAVRCFLPAAHPASPPLCRGPGRQRPSGFRGRATDTLKECNALPLRLEPWCCPVVGFSLQRCMEMTTVYTNAVRPLLPMDGVMAWSKLCLPPAGSAVHHDRRARTQGDLHPAFTGGDGPTRRQPVAGGPARATARFGGITRGPHFYPNGRSKARERQHGPWRCRPSPKG
jgi:hypothetical protein